MFNKAFCFCLPHLLNIGLGIAFFILSYIIYRILFFALLRMAKSELFTKVVRGIRRPLFWLFMAEAAFVCVYLADLKPNITRFLITTVLVLLVINVGWIFIRLVKLLFRHMIEKYQEDDEKKSSVVQLQFVYRLVVIVVGILTVGGILVLFPSAKHLGVGLLGSAGIAGLVLGMAAKPIFLNFMAGLQIALTKTIRLEDAVVIDGEFGYIEAIHLTYVVVRSWDLKRRIIPISQFIDKPFQNLDLKNSEQLGSVLLTVDYRTPIKRVRAKFQEIVESCPQYSGKGYQLQVVELLQNNMQVRLMMTGKDAASTFELRCFVREKLIEFLQKEHPGSLPVASQMINLESI